MEWPGSTHSRFIRSPPPNHFCIVVPWPILFRSPGAFARESNRLTTAFRLILASRISFFVGGVGLGIASRGGNASTMASEAGLLGAAAFFLAIVSWFTIVLAARTSLESGIPSFYLRWRASASRTFMLLEDARHSAMYRVSGRDRDRRPRRARDRVTVALRILLAIPQFVVLFFVLLAWCFTTIAAWFIILFTGSYPEGLHGFGVGALRWLLRVQAHSAARG